MSRQRLFFFSQAPGVGGGERAVLPVLHQLSDIELIVAGPPPVTAYAADLGVQAIELELPRAHRLTHAGRTVAGAVRVQRLFRRTACDVLYANGTRAIPYALGAALLGSRPLIFHHHGLLASGAVRVLSRTVDRWADAIVVPSRAAAEPFRKSPALHIVANGVDAAHFRPASDPSARKRALGLRTEVPVVGTLTRPAPTKGMSEFLHFARNAAALPHGPQFLLAGGPVFPHEREPYEYDVRRARELGVFVTGYLDDPVSAYQAMDVFVHLGEPEGFGLTVLEAIACGVPVVAYDWGAIPEVFGGLVQLVPPHDVDAAVAAVAELLNDTTKRADYARAGRDAAVQRFTTDSAAVELRRVIASVAQ